ncbi:hypothetical protein OSJ77_11250 [Phyllobacterium sp. 0TCS1.6C]|uniref:hypothetical protein n=1 Tax=unclassified Phyllobacterium TaxID=2638441 RepID=UPI002264BEA3|nr:MULTISPECIES: hypothetical protein [unclassified Phyllobacterium]MCX8280771.1 hypothetical protein [Phyllobacterium sp. 0TCS1.6C]MCX8292652.1 hypothetical protein [Phyllobacterium sp. 0TCS1.6A]
MKKLNAPVIAQRKNTSSEERYAQTTKIANEIIAEEVRRREANTERLRLLRLEQEIKTDLAEAKAPKASKKAGKRSSR